MVCIKSKDFIKPMVVFLLIATIFLTFVGSTLARDNGSDLNFVGEPEYELVNKVARGGKPIGWSYKINLKIQNAGNVISRDTIVNITDQEGVSLSKNVRIDAGETKTISFNWSTISEADQTISASFYPADLDENKNQYNSGSTNFKIIIEDEDSVPAASTPGFELLLMLFALIGFTILKKKK